MAKHIRAFNAAIEVALRSPMLNKHGAVLVKGGKVIASGYNHFGDSASGSVFTHAEIAASRKKRRECVKGVRPLCCTR